LKLRVFADNFATKL